MSGIHLFKLASLHNDWLAKRHSVIAGNIANANTPGYRSREIEAFDAALEQVGMSMAITKYGHMRPAGDQSSPAVESEKAKSWEVYHSGNTVSVEQQLIEAGGVSRSYTLNTNVLSSFHRMLNAAAARGS